MVSSLPPFTTSSWWDKLTGLAGSNPRARDAALLRAATELFAQGPPHGHDAIRRYAELAIHFLPRVSAEDRAFVAARLAGRADVPAEVIRLLAAGDRPPPSGIWEFLALAPAERLARLAALATHLHKHPAANPDASPAEIIDRAFRSALAGARLVAHARNGRREALVETAAAGLDLPAEAIAAAFSDAHGEAAAVLLKALGLDTVQARQLFLLATRTIGYDVAAFFRLSDLYAGMEPHVAESLVARWRQAEAPVTPRHEPHFAPEKPARAGVPAEATEHRAKTAERARG